MYCQGTLGAPIPLTPDPAPHVPLWQGTGYALCWTTAAGVTLPAGADCSATGTAMSSGRHFTYPTAASFPFTLAAGSSCRPYPDPNQNSFLLFVDGPCTITIPADNGSAQASVTYTFGAVAAPAPAVNGTVSHPGVSTVRVGGARPLQSVTCRYETEVLMNVLAPCIGVFLTWSVDEGRRSCAIRTDSDRRHPSLGSVSVTFTRPGTCVVRGRYPGAGYTTESYLFRVRPRR